MNAKTPLNESTWCETGSLYPAEKYMSKAEKNYLSDYELVLK